MWFRFSCSLDVRNSGGLPEQPVHEPFRTVYVPEPLAGVVEGFRWALLGSELIRLSQCVVGLVGDGGFAVVSGRFLFPPHGKEPRGPDLMKPIIESRVLESAHRLHGRGRGYRTLRDTLTETAGNTWRG